MLYDDISKPDSQKLKQQKTGRKLTDQHAGFFSLLFRLVYSLVSAYGFLLNTLFAFVSTCVSILEYTRIISYLILFALLLSFTIVIPPDCFPITYDAILIYVYNNLVITILNLCKIPFIHPSCGTRPARHHPHREDPVFSEYS